MVQHAVISGLVQTVFFKLLNGSDENLNILVAPFDR